jgi:ATP-dependent DNA helicase RecQ
MPDRHTESKSEAASQTALESNAHVDNRFDEALFAKLKGLRSMLAREVQVPAYIIFTDATLRDMCRKRPTTADEFLQVSGVGERKLQKYGETFMKIIREGI